MEPRSLGGRLVTPALLVVIAGILHVAWDLLGVRLGVDPAGPAMALGRRLMLGAILLSLALMAVRVVNAVFWGGWVARKAGGDPPRLLTDLASGIALSAAGIAVLGWVFEVEITGLVATSGVAVAIVGFALRSMIADAASGIAMSLERPFHIGDWIEAEGVQGRVVQVTWRATYLQNRENVRIVVPNGRLAAGSFRRFAAEGAVSFEMVEVVLAFTVTGHQAERLLLSAASQVPEIARLPQAPYARIQGFNEAGVVWRLFFPVDDWTAAGRLRYQVQRNLLRNLHYAGTELPAARWQLVDPDRPAAARPDPAQALPGFLRRVELFASLSDEDLEGLGRHAEVRLFSRGEPVVRQGEDGASLFVLREGLLSVSTRLPDGSERTVAQLTPGSFFGEMSLLTGAPRAASVVPQVDSVVMEIGKELLVPLMQARPDLATIMSDYLAHRQNTTVAALERDDIEVRRDRAGDLLARVRGFFGLDAKVPA